MPAKATIRERIERNIKVNPITGCWEWTGYILPNGYVQLPSNRKTFIAHRVAYQEYIGPIPEGLEIDHLCRVRHCINPKHLELVTHRENCRRSDGEGGGRINRSKTHCPKGHPYSGHNLRIENTKTYGNFKKERYVHRICRTCKNAIRRRALKRKMRELKKPENLSKLLAWRARDHSYRIKYRRKEMG